jgi:hypothetical protein
VVTDLEAIKERLAAATPGPWTQWATHYVCDKREKIAGPMLARDADLIAHAPEDLAALVEEVERLRADLNDAYNMTSGLIDDLNRLRERAEGLEHKLRMMHRWNPYTTDSDTLRNLGLDPDAPCSCDRCAEVTRR